MQLDKEAGERAQHSTSTAHSLLRFLRLAHASSFAVAIAVAVTVTVAVLPSIHIRRARGSWATANASMHQSRKRGGSPRASGIADACMPTLPSAVAGHGQFYSIQVSDIVFTFALARSCWWSWSC
jgi:hypothetical protein